MRRRQAYHPGFRAFQASPHLRCRACRRSVRLACRHRLSVQRPARRQARSPTPRPTDRRSIRLRPDRPHFLRSQQHRQSAHLAVPGRLVRRRRIRPRSPRCPLLSCHHHRLRRRPVLLILLHRSRRHLRLRHRLRFPMHCRLTDRPIRLRRPPQHRLHPHHHRLRPHRHPSAPTRHHSGLSHPGLLNRPTSPRLRRPRHCRLLRHRPSGPMHRRLRLTRRHLYRMLRRRQQHCRLHLRIHRRYPTRRHCFRKRHLLRQQLRHRCPTRLPGRPTNRRRLRCSVRRTRHSNPGKCFHLQTHRRLHHLQRPRRSGPGSRNRPDHRRPHRCPCWASVLLRRHHPRHLPKVFRAWGRCCPMNRHPMHRRRCLNRRPTHHPSNPMRHRRHRRHPSNHPSRRLHRLRLRHPWNRPSNHRPMRRRR